MGSLKPGLALMIRIYSHCAARLVIIFISNLVIMVVGGGVGILIHMDLPTPSISSVTFYYSDCLSCTFNFPFDILRIIVIYRPPRPDYSIFFDEFSDCINNGLYSSSFKFICMGDFNYHFDSMSQPHSLFRQLTESFGLHQHISCPTHTSGNILDLIFTPNNSVHFTLYSF